MDKLNISPSTSKQHILKKIPKHHEDAGISPQISYTPVNSHSNDVNILQTLGFSIFNWPLLVSLVSEFTGVYLTTKQVLLPGSKNRWILQMSRDVRRSWRFMPRYQCGMGPSTNTTRQPWGECWNHITIPEKNGRREFPKDDDASENEKSVGISLASNMVSFGRVCKLFRRGICCFFCWVGVAALN